MTPKANPNEACSMQAQRRRRGLNCTHTKTRESREQASTKRASSHEQEMATDFFSAEPDLKRISLYFISSSSQLNQLKHGVSKRALSRK
jgi:hypothetical protein